MISKEEIWNTLRFQEKQKQIAGKVWAEERREHQKRMLKYWTKVKGGKSNTVEMTLSIGGRKNIKIIVVGIVIINNIFSLLEHYRPTYGFFIQILTCKQCKQTKLVIQNSF